MNKKGTVTGQHRWGMNQLINKWRYKELYNSVAKNNNNNNPIRQWTEGLNRHFPKKTHRLPTRYMRRCSTSLIIREMQIKSTMRYHLPPVRITIIKKTEIVSVGEDVEKREHLCTVGGNVNWCGHYRKHYGVS